MFRIAAGETWVEEVPVSDPNTCNHKDSNNNMNTGDTKNNAATMSLKHLYMAVEPLE